MSTHWDIVILFCLLEGTRKDRKIVPHHTVGLGKNGSANFPRSGDASLKSLYGGAGIAAEMTELCSHDLVLLKNTPLACRFAKIHPVG